MGVNTLTSMPLFCNGAVPTAYRRTPGRRSSTSAPRLPPKKLLINSNEALCSATQKTMQYSHALVLPAFMKLLTVSSRHFCLLVMYQPFQVMTTYKQGRGRCSHKYHAHNSIIPFQSVKLVQHPNKDFQPKSFKVFSGSRHCITPWSDNRFTKPNRAHYTDTQRHPTKVGPCARLHLLKIIQFLDNGGLRDPIHGRHRLLIQSSHQIKPKHGRYRVAMSLHKSRVNKSTPSQATESRPLPAHTKFVPGLFLALNLPVTQPTRLQQPCKE